MQAQITQRVRLLLSHYMPLNTFQSYIFLSLPRYKTTLIFVVLFFFTTAYKFVLGCIVCGFLFSNPPKFPLQ